MKIRTGFVSNSSSASFVASLSILTKEQVQSIVDYCDDPDQNEDGWSAYVNVGMGLWKDTRLWIMVLSVIGWKNKILTK